MLLGRYVENWEGWKFAGRELEKQLHGEASYENPNGIHEDEYMPMQNMVYPLEIIPEREDVLKVHEKTACTVVESPENVYYIAITTYGGDFSQDLALAYYILEKRIPYEVAIRVNIQAMSLALEDYEKLMKVLVQELPIHALRAYELLEKIRKMENFLIE